MITLRSSVPFLLVCPPSAVVYVTCAGVLQLFDGFREDAASILHRLPEEHESGFVSCACFALGSFVDVLGVTLLHSVPQGGMRGHAISFVA